MPTKDVTLSAKVLNQLGRGAILRCREICDQALAEIDTYLRVNTKLTPRHEAAIVNKQAIAACKELLADSQILPSRDLHDRLVSRGIHLKAADPHRRLVQLLSENRTVFKAGNGKGWSLRVSPESSTNQQEDAM